MTPLDYYKQIMQALGVGGANAAVSPMNRLTSNDMNTVRAMQGLPAPGPTTSPLTAIRAEDVNYIRSQRGLPPPPAPKMDGLATLSNEDVDFIRGRGNMATARHGEINYANNQMGSPSVGGPINLGNEQRFNPTAPTMAPMPANPAEAGPLNIPVTQGSPFVGNPLPSDYGSPFVGSPLPSTAGSPFVGSPYRVDDGSPYVGSPMRRSAATPGPGQIQLSAANGGGVAPIPTPPGRPQGPAQAYTMDPGDGGIVRTFVAQNGQLPDVPGMNVQGLDYMPKGFFSGLLG